MYSCNSTHRCGGCCLVDDQTIEYGEFTTFSCDTQLDTCVSLEAIHLAQPVSVFLYWQNNAVDLISSDPSKLFF